MSINPIITVNVSRGKYDIDVRRSTDVFDKTAAAASMADFLETSNRLFKKFASKIQKSKRFLL
jgi:hypothetical protein